MRFDILLSLFQAVSQLSFIFDFNFPLIEIPDTLFVAHTAEKLNSAEIEIFTHLNIFIRKYVLVHLAFVLLLMTALEAAQKQWADLQKRAPLATLWSPNNRTLHIS